MAATIHISTITKQLLDMLKEKEYMKTYDRLLWHVLTRHANIPSSMFGTVKRLRWRKEEDRLKFREL